MKLFVANRVAEAQELTKGIAWKHVRTHDNPADLASRGVIASDLVDNKLWFNGPKWLRESPSEWPVSEFSVDRQAEEATSIESKPMISLSVVKREIFPRIESPDHSDGKLLIDYYGSMMKLVRVVSSTQLERPRGINQSALEEMNI